MNRSNAPRLLQYALLSTVFFTVVFSFLSFFIWDAYAFIGVSVGGLMGSFNWYMLALYSKKTKTHPQYRTIFTLALVLKSILFLFVCFFCVATAHIHKEGFALGITAMVLGAFVGLFSNRLTNEKNYPCTKS